MAAAAEGKAARRAGTAGTNLTSIAHVAFEGEGLVDDLVVNSGEPSFIFGTVFILTLAEFKR